jgi:hypothetical protein
MDQKHNGTTSMMISALLEYTLGLGMTGSLLG